MSPVTMKAATHTSIGVLAACVPLFLCYAAPGAAANGPQARGDIENHAVVTSLPTPDGKDRLRVLAYPQPLSPPRVCPKHRWEYPYVCSGYATAAGRGGEPEIRLSVYAQSRKRIDTAAGVARMLLRLWDLCKSRLKLDHPWLYDYRVDVFLADGGKAGGEQGVFEGPDAGGRLHKHNTIYIYDLDSFTEPAEMAREVAHEYGHAVLPAVGGFKEPEYWATGFLGERLFLSWLHREMSAGALTPKDAMGASAEALGEWLTKHATPLEDRIWLRGPDMKALAGSGKAAMDQYIGVLLQADRAFPSALYRALRLSGGLEATDAVRGVVRAVEERGRWEVHLPKQLTGKEVWLPLRGRWSFTGAEQTARRRDWVRVKPRADLVVAVRQK